MRAPMAQSLVGLVGGAVERLATKLVPLIPSLVRQPLARLHRPLARFIAARPYQRRYQGGFLWDIRPEDDMMHHSLEVARGRMPAVGVMLAEHPLPYYHAARMYFQGGDFHVAEIENLLRGVGVSLDDGASLLEFACGYGRMTRHLVHKVNPSKVTVSDIDHRGVDFVRTSLQVAGFYSTTTGYQLAHDGRYDVIIVVSLFSHLSVEDWEPWLQRLYGMLNPGGVLLFTTHGSHAYDMSVGQFGHQAFERKADGFFYTGSNETRGRLASAHYGVTFVTEEYVRRAVAQIGSGSVIDYFPRGLTGYQDVYVVKRPAEQQAAAVPAGAHIQTGTPSARPERA